MTLHKLNPLRTLRLRVGLLVLGVIAALAVFTTQYFSERLTNSYREAGRAQLGAIASLWDDSFRLKQLGHPEGIQRRINALRQKNETMHKLSVSWHDPSGGTWLVQSGHEHDPDGTKRDVTGAVTRSESVANPAPIDERDFRYHEVNATDGAHYAELNYPIRRFRDGRQQLVGALELHYDLKQLDQSLAADKSALTMASALAAVTAALLISLLLSRAVLSPLDRLRAATRRIGGGEVAARLNWKRGDEIGALARDFDRMAAELETAHGHLEELALTDPLTGLLNHRAFQERMRQELRRAEREAYAVSVVALDVDHFKQVNDRWGHAAGDQVLRALATSIRGELRPSDVCGRVGGDEFMLAIARAGFERTEQIIDRLRERIASMQFGPAGERVTLSVGISEFPRHSLSQEELMHRDELEMDVRVRTGRVRDLVTGLSRAPHVDGQSHRVVVVDAGVAQEALVEDLEARDLADRRAGSGHRGDRLLERRRSRDDGVPARASRDASNSELGLVEPTRVSARSIVLSSSRPPALWPK
ncbi:MAG: GGDEF domain-containing protein [Thermoleophilaceae bacterium]|nr:GGDEF domain-containing protein [Thermoleophilaceae bacterium]